MPWAISFSPRFPSGPVVVLTVADIVLLMLFSFSFALSSLRNINHIEQTSQS